MGKAYENYYEKKVIETKSFAETRAALESMMKLKPKPDIIFQDEIKVCKSCGVVREDNSRYCKYCGSKH